MNYCFFLLPLLAFSSLTSSRVNSQDRNEKDLLYKTVYVYFGEIKASPNYLKVYGDFYTSLGKSYRIDGKVIRGTSLTNDPSLDGAFWRFSVPEDAYSCIFNLCDLNGELYISSDISTITSCVYIFNTKHYAFMEPSSGWGPLSLKLNVFADYFVVDINPNFLSEDGGCLLYPSLKKYLFDNLIDYSEHKSETLEWNDKYIGKTSFKRKWQLIKECYENKTATDDNSYWYYILGGLLLVLAFLAFYSFYLKEIWKAKKLK